MQDIELLEQACRDFRENYYPDLNVELVHALKKQLIKVKKSLDEVILR